MNAIAYCGLVCCVCSENKDCIGCQDRGCEIHGWCNKPRIRAFAEFAKRYGADELEKCLLRNKEKGIIYHYDGQLVGDYDNCQTEEEIIEMIKIGGVQNDSNRFAKLYEKSM